MGRARGRAFGGRTAPGRMVLAACLAALALGAGGILEPSRALAADRPARSETAKVPVIYQKKRSFRIPFHIDEQGRARLKEVQLWVSEDFGFHWEPKSRTAPDLGKFTFRTTHDGEYWFATRTLTVDDEYSPAMDQQVEPSMKVIVDSSSPSVVLESEGRRGSMAAVRWEVKDEHLDLKTLTLEYQLEGAREWRRAPIQRRALLGAQKWDAGSADAVKVRATVADKAGNIGEAEIMLPEGTAGASDFATADIDAQAPPIEQISSSRSQITAGPEFTPIQDDSRRSARPAAGSRNALTRRPQNDDGGFGGTSSTAPDWQGSNSGIAVGGSRAGRAPFPQPGPSSSQMPASGEPFPSPPSGDSEQIANSNPDGQQTRVVPSPRFRLNYAIDDAPNGAAAVELWMTKDGGRNWTRRGEDPDRVSPFEVDLEGEGTFGLTLVARSASGLGDPPPAPGDPPQTWVEVDSTPPSVQLYPPQVGTGANAGKVAITWRASDLHLPPRSVSLLWRPDQPGAAWQPIIQAQQENSGQYVWTVPSDFPAKFHIRVEAVDSVAHHGWAETTDAAPVIVDRSRPRSRIIGLDPNARAGSGPSAPSLR